MFGKQIVLLLVLLVVLPVASWSDEFRSILVDSWNWGSGYAMVDPASTQEMVDRVKSWNCNVILLEVRKRSDAYYYSTLEPTGTDPSPVPGYDPLADVITKAHAQGIEVHPWIVPYRVWTKIAPPPHSTPEHIYYLHPEWFSQYVDGAQQYGGNNTSLDPGIPAVEDYLMQVFMDIVQRYDIDGFMLDYIRYYSTTWGYNPIAVARFNDEYGLSGIPWSNDPLWCQWRRDQVSNLVKRLYLEVRSAKPQVKVGALVFRTARMSRDSVLQDWDRWMAEHYMDYASPMNYTTDNEIFHANAVDSLSRGYGHHIYMGIHGQTNTVDNIVWQTNDGRTLGFPGMHLYSYAHCNAGTPDQEVLRNAWLAGPFATPTAVPEMPWLTVPTKGYLKGFIRGEDGNAAYPVTATIIGPDASTKNSGTGFYGFSEIEPGTYMVRVTSPAFLPVEQQVTITAGHVSTLDFTLRRETVAPSISNVRVENIQGTHARICWDTDEASSSQVEFGLTPELGSRTTEDRLRVTSHTTYLTGLRPFTTYHCRVRSRDAAGNVAESAGFTLRTQIDDQAPDIIIDNRDSGCTAHGRWNTGTSAPGRYGADYLWANATDPLTCAVFTPVILTPGPYDVYIWYSQASNRSTQARWSIHYDGGMVESMVNEQVNGGRWNLLADDVPFACGRSGYVATYSDTNTVAIADAVRFVYKGDPSGPTPATIAGAKYHPDGDIVILQDKAVSANFGDYFYICESAEDQTSGIRVNGAGPAEGSLVSLSGVIHTGNGERVIDLPSIQSRDGTGSPHPLLMLSRELGGGALNAWTRGVTGGEGLNNIGLLVSVAGRVTQVGEGFFIIDGSVRVDSARLTSLPTERSFVIVTGICGTERSGSDIRPVMKPRRDSDVTCYR